MNRLRLLHLTLLAALVALAGLAFQPVYADAAFGSTVVAAAVASTGLWIVVAVQWPARQGLSMVVSLVGYLFLLANTVLSDAALVVLPTPETVTEALNGLINGWDRLLTTDIPVAGTTSLLVIPPSVVWLAAFASAELALRTRSKLAPVVPALLVFGVGVFFSGTDSGDRPLATALLILLALVVVLLRSQRSPGLITDVDPIDEASRTGRLIVEVDEVEVHRATARPRVRALGLGAALVVLAAALAPVIGPRLPFVSAREPFDPRSALDDEPEAREDLSPLVMLKSLLTEEPVRDLFTVQVTGLPQNWRLLVLDDFDGEQWRSRAVYENAGTQLPEPEVAGPENTEELVQQIDIDELDGPWLPAASRPTSVSASDDFQAQVDPESGSLVTDRDDVDGLSYSVVSEVPAATVDELEQAALSQDPALDRYTELPLPGAGEPLDTLVQIQEQAIQVTRRAATPYAAMRRLEAYFRQGEFDYDADVEPGHSYGHLQHFLFGSRQGSAEQFAAGFAVMARAAGYPARLAVGFAPGAQTENGSLQVRSSDAHAWPEVYFDGLGWLPFEPNPTRQALDESEVAEAEAPPRPDSPATEDVDTAQTEAEQRAAEQEREDTIRRVALLVAGTIVTAVALLIGALRWVRRRRRRRRQAGTPDERVIGAYQEALDEFSESGLRGTQYLTGAELAAMADERFGADVARYAGDVANLANAALFDPRPADPGSADRAWIDLAELHRALRSEQSRRAKVLRLVDPRPLIKRR